MNSLLYSLLFLPVLISFFASGVLQEDPSEVNLSTAAVDTKSQIPMDCDDGMPAEKPCAESAKQPPSKRNLEALTGSPLEEKMVEEINWAFKRLVEEVTKKCCIY